ncbi:butyrophilin subfamily 1 member A1-like isoform X2 [Sus scrofa]|uniref:B30.2/SPRY domain-containing protein n=1 Tax=Sus scrofa TaxID=9823 RepID=A0A5G2QN14_PIG|nr:butyrophilin subfamily 1 member A1-like isoform X2 [Sus scrofa]
MNKLSKIMSAALLITILNLFYQVASEKPGENENCSDKNIIIIVLGIIAAIMTLLFLVFCKLYFKTRGSLHGHSGALQDEIARRKAQFKKAWRDAPLYPDWRKEEFKAANVTLDEATAHPALLVSERGRRVTWQETCQDLPRSTQRFNSIPCVLGQLRINSGRACWEVEVGDMQSWDLGICRDNVTREGVFTMSPQNGFWAIRLYDGDYWALTSPETSLPLRERPLKVGIFLDYEAGDVSFYNMTDGSHIFTFPQSTFYGVLRPLFRLWSSDSGSLTICSAEGECTDVVIHMPTLQVK